MFKAARVRWEVFGEVLADATGRIFSAVFYFTIMVPFGIGTRLLGDPLNVKNDDVRWVEREPVSSSLEEARRQG